MDDHSNVVGRLAVTASVFCGLLLALDANSAAYVEVGTLPQPGATERAEVFDAATATLFSIPYYPDWQNKVYTSRHGPNDTFAWRETTPYSYTWSYWGRGAADGRNLYFNGPIEAGNTFQSRFAPINADGSLGAWQSTTPAPIPLGPRGRSLHQTFLYSGRLYISGGWRGDGIPAYADIWHAPIQAGGALGSFTQTTDLPEPMVSHSAAVAPTAGCSSPMGRTFTWRKSTRTDRLARSPNSRRSLA